MAKGDMMRQMISTALDVYSPHYARFSGKDFFCFFKDLPTGGGKRRKIYPADANAMIIILKQSKKVEVVDGTYDPLLFIKVDEEDE